MFKQIPNILTIVRFLLIPLIIIFAFQKEYVLTIFIIILSGLTDILDGFIARRFHLVSNFGKLMDPLADKATQITLLAVLAVQDLISFWILLIVLVKEIIMIAGASFLYGKELVVSSKWYGKISTALFYLAIVCSLFIIYWNTFIIKHSEKLNRLPSFDRGIYLLAISFTIFSLFMYLKTFYIKGYLKELKK